MKCIFVERTEEVANGVRSLGTRYYSATTVQTIKIRNNMLTSNIEMVLTGGHGHILLDFIVNKASS